MPPKEVPIGIGIMTLTKGELKPLKGKAKMVRVATTIRKLDLLIKGLVRKTLHTIVILIRKHFIH